MPKISSSLRPETRAADLIQEAVEILSNQGVALKELTGGLLYGEVVPSFAASAGTIVYDFYVAIEAKEYGQKLFSKVVLY